MTWPAREHAADRLIATAQSLGDRPGCRARCLPAPTHGSVPVRPMPHITSSRMSSAPWRLQMSRTARKYPSGAGTQPAVAPTTGSATNAATVSGPRRWNSASSSAASRATKSASDFMIALFMIGERRRHVAESGRQQWRIGFAAPGIAAGGERAQRIAVIALAARDEVLTLLFATLDKILPRQLDAGFDCFRSAADEIGVGQPPGLVAKQMIGQRFRWFGRKKTVCA